MEILEHSTEHETYKELRQRAKELEIRYPKPYYKMNKAELIQAINLMVDCLNEDLLNRQEDKQERKIMTDYLKQALKIYEVEIQLENDCADENRDIESFTLEEVRRNVEYCIERMEMDLTELHEDWEEDVEQIEDAKSTIKQCRWWLNKYKDN